MKRMIYLIVFLLFTISISAYEVEYVHQDHLGNNIAITNEEGDIIWKADYEPFGDSFNEVGDNNKKYNNKEEDNTNLLYYGARYYDNNIGRFTTPDPLSGSITDPQTLNRYVYVSNNPMKYIDPTGMVFRYGVINSNSLKRKGGGFPTTFYFGVGLENIFLSEKIVDGDISFDFATSGNKIHQKMTHPFYNSLNLDLFANLGKLGKIGLEHTSIHELSDIIDNDVRWKGYPNTERVEVHLLRGRGVEAPLLMSEEDLGKPLSYERKIFYKWIGGSTDNVLWKNNYKNTEISLGTSHANDYSTINSLLGFKGPPVPISNSFGYWKGGFGRITQSLGGMTISLAGINDPSSPLLVGGIQSKINLYENSKVGYLDLSISGQKSNKGSGAVCITLSCGGNN